MIISRGIYDFTFGYGMGDYYIHVRNTKSGNTIINVEPVYYEQVIEFLDVVELTSDEKQSVVDYYDKCRIEDI